MNNTSERLRSAVYALCRNGDARGRLISALQTLAPLREVDFSVQRLRQRFSEIRRLGDQVDRSDGTISASVLAMDDEAVWAATEQILQLYELVVRVELGSLSEEEL